MCIGSIIDSSLSLFALFYFIYYYYSYPSDLGSSFPYFSYSFTYSYLNNDYSKVLAWSNYYFLLLPTILDTITILLAATINPATITTAIKNCYWNDALLDKYNVKLYYWAELYAVRFIVWDFTPFFVSSTDKFRLKDIYCRVSLNWSATIIP